MRVRLEDCEILDVRILYTQGCYSKTRYWVKGWVYPDEGDFKWIHGYTGRETVITVESISPIKTFKVEG